MKYPCLRYEKDGIDYQYADDMKYQSMDRYIVTVIDRSVDSPYADMLLQGFKYSSFDREFKSDNLCHTVIIIYY